MTPFTYLIGWSKLDLWYYGVRYAKFCHPETLWTSYFTSCKRVRELRGEHGEPDVVAIRKIFQTAEAAIEWEAKVLQRLKAASSYKWINRNVKGSIYNSPEQYKEIGRKGSATKRNGPKRVSWNKGLSKHTDPRVAAYAERRKGQVFSEDHKQKMRDSHKNRTYENYGKYVRSEKEISIVRDRMMDHTSYQFDHKDGRQFIGTRVAFREQYPSITVNMISNVTTGLVKRTGGWSIKPCHTPS